MFIKVSLLLQDHLLARMLLALDGKSLVDVSLLTQVVHEGTPRGFAFSALLECLRVSNDDETDACSGKQDVESLRR